MFKRIISFLFAILILCSSVCFAVDRGIPEGAVGIWEVADLGTRTPVYEDDDGKLAQYYLDKPNAAYMMNYLPYGALIMDHQNSNINGHIWNVGKITIDSTARFITEDKTEEYICYLVCRAKSGGIGYSIGWNIIKPESEEDILCASCASPDEVYLACFRMVRSW